MIKVMKAIANQFEQSIFSVFGLHDYNYFWALKVVCRNIGQLFAVMFQDSKMAKSFTTNAGT